MNFASIVEVVAISACLMLFQEIALPPNMKIYSEVDLLLSKHSAKLDLNIQSPLNDRIYYMWASSLWYSTNITKLSLYFPVHWSRVS